MLQCISMTFTKFSNNLFHLFFVSHSGRERVEVVYGRDGAINDDIVWGKDKVFDDSVLIIIVQKSTICKFQWV